MDKILVTGATGFTGYNLCKRLRNEEREVVAFVRPSKREKPLLEIGVECRHVDIRDAREVREAFEVFDRVYHIAAAYRGERVDREEFQRINVDATKNMLDAAVALGVGRFVHCSTVGVQGDINDPPVKEDYRFDPGDHYQDSKLEGELLARKYFEKGLPGAVVRPVAIYGPGDTRFLKLFKAVANGTFVMIGDGKTLYHMTFIDDLVEGFIRAGTEEKALGEVFTIAGPEYTTIRELVDMIADVLGRPRPRLRVPLWPVMMVAHICERVCRVINVSPPIYPRRVGFFKKSRAFDTEKAQCLLGHKPRIHLREGLARTAEWYKAEGLL